MSRRRGRHPLVPNAVAGAAICLALAASIATTEAAPAPAAAAGKLRTTAVSVGLREYRIALYRSRVLPGRVRLNMENLGEDGHDLRVIGPTGTRTIRGSSPELRPGACSTLTVRLRKRGVYTLVCTLADHSRGGWSPGCGWSKRCNPPSAGVAYTSEMTPSIEGRPMSDTKPKTRVPALAQARKQYELALSDTSADLAWAALHCGRLMHLAGDLEGARQAFRSAMIADDPDYTAVAAYHLGMLCEDLGDVDAAEAAYREAADSGHPKHASAAAYKLGGLLQAQGDLDAARDAFERAADAPNAWYGHLSRSALSALD